MCSVLFQAFQNPGNFILGIKSLCQKDDSFVETCSEIQRRAVSKALPPGNKLCSSRAIRNILYVFLS